MAGCAPYPFARERATGLSTQQIEACSRTNGHIRVTIISSTCCKLRSRLCSFIIGGVVVSRQIRTSANMLRDLAVAACGNVLTYARALAELEPCARAFCRRSPSPPTAVRSSRRAALIEALRPRSLVNVARQLRRLAIVFSICIGARAALVTQRRKNTAATKQAESLFIAV